MLSIWNNLGLPLCHTEDYDYIYPCLTFEPYLEPILTICEYDFFYCAPVNKLVSTALL